MTTPTTPHSPDASAPRPLLGGRYRLTERIARGGMGEVWKAVDEVLNRPVALKVLRPEYADEEVFLERFRSEARNTAALVHTGIAQVYDFGQAVSGGASVPFIVMELVPGEPLSQIIERYGALALDRALDLVAQAARALQAAHAGGVIHRDVKPANLLITPSGTVKVTDFGIARAGDSLPLTRSGTVMGTAHYLAPEVISTRAGAAPVSDVYALGVVLYECLAGRRPFIGDNPLAVAMSHLNDPPPPISGLPASVERLLDSVLAKDPALRPSTAAELAHRLVALRIDLAAAESPEVVAAKLGPHADPAAVRTAAARWKRGANRRREEVYDLGAPLEHRPLSHRARPERTAPAPARPGGHRRKPKPPALRRPSVLAAAATVVILGLGSLWALELPAGSALVPAVAGVSESDAGRTLKASGFGVKVLREVDEGVPAGVVMSQQPRAGTKLSTRGNVEIIVSSGPPAVLIDPADWQGLAFVDVRDGLQSRGLNVLTQGVVGSGEPGTVADVTPHGPVPVGETVTVSVIVSTEPGTGTRTDAAPPPAAGIASPAKRSFPSTQQEGPRR
ncbi:MAG: protein kinase domain-containing protein [Sporichthyaceae bacterium]